MTRGRVKFFSTTKGYGFIAHELGDAFFHYTDICVNGFKAVSIGMLVEYELQVDYNGQLKAKNVVPLAVSWEEVAVIDVQSAKIRELEDQLARIYREEKRKEIQ